MDRGFSVAAIKTPGAISALAATKIDGERILASPQS